MTVSERIQDQSFAYDTDFPPDCAEGRPLSTMARPRRSRQQPLRRAMKACARVVARRR
jgi:hypothetical protein